MSFGPVVARQLALAGAAAARELAAWQREQAEVAARSAEDRQAAYTASEQARAETRGDHYDALALAGGQLPPRTLSDVLAEVAVAADPVVRDRSAEYGSEANPARLLDGADLGDPQARRSMFDDDQLGRATAMHGDTFMAVQVARFEQRRRRGGGEVSRSGNNAGGRRCFR